MQKPDDEHTRPITLYVESIIPASLQHVDRRRVTQLDVELSPELQRQLIKLMQAEPIKRTITIRFAGRLVLL